MRYVVTNYLGSTPARSYDDHELICLNADKFFGYPPEIRQFIALHEEGHLKLKTDSEFEADKYAYDSLKFTFPGSLKWAVLSLSRVLPMNTKEQQLRLIKMYEYALQDDFRETGDPALAYEADFTWQLFNEVQNSPFPLTDGPSVPSSEYEGYDKAGLDILWPTVGQWFHTVPLDGSAGADASASQNDGTQPVPSPNPPVGPLAAIAHQAWVKQYLGYPLTASERSLLTIYPMPDDFYVAEVNRDEVVPIQTNTVTMTPHRYHRRRNYSGLLMLAAIVIILIILFRSKK